MSPLEHPLKHSFAWACTAICSEECCNENATTTINTNDNSTIDDNCSGKNLLKSATSKTYVKNDAKNWAIQYEFGLCIGFQGEDTVTLGNLIVPKCAVGQVFEMPPGLANFEYDGLLGLGLSTEGKAAPVLYTAEQQKLLKQPIFTVFLNNTSQGFITYGGLDEKYCSPDVEYVNITSDIWYQFKMDSFSMGAENSSDGWEVISELNSKKILAPEAISTQLLQAAGASENGTIDCNATFEDLKLIINAKEYVIPSKYLILKNNNECMFAVGGRNTTNSNWILGEPFIRSYCNIYGFKDKTIGFAKAIAQFA
uniref:Peptidase A1 domain-containing protein n=1 Tax=Panagrolaimus superbus TaxID=310955 RepID=A0A914YET0_9BILA